MNAIRPDFLAALDERLAPRTAGALPGPRTYGMVTNALESDDIDAVKAELVHTRAHYQSLEYMLNDEAGITAAIAGAIEEGVLPAPETPAEMLALVARAYSREVTEQAYDTAHNIGFFVGALGMTVDDALRQFYPDLDYSDPERELTDDELAALSGQAD